MMCSRARALLGAYRRDDWSPEELAALGQHLSICAECRKVEASYRSVGESIRQLPSITPPPAFRARVFAAIQADQGRLKPSIARLAAEDTSPSLPVVRPIPITRRRPQIQFSTGIKAAMAIAAMLLLTVAVAQFAPLQSLSSLAGNLGAAGNTSSPNVAKFAPDAHYSNVTGALASKAWLVYVASDAAGGAMLFAENRQAKRALQLLSAPATTPITLRAVTESWVLWSVGNTASSWTLYAERIPASSSAKAETPRVLASAENADSALTDVWARGNTALVALAGASVAGEIEAFNLSDPVGVGSIVAKASTTGHILSDVSSDGSAYYWADVWVDAATGWHSRPWRSDASGANARPLLDDDHAFHPQAGSGTLAWVEVPQGTPSGDVTAAGSVTGAFTGTVMERDLATGRQHSVGEQAQVASLHGHGTLLLWRSGSKSHSYDVGAGKPSTIEQQIQSAAWAEMSDTSVTWSAGSGASIYVYDVA